MERAQQDSLTHLILDEIEGPLWTASRHSFILPKDKRVAEIKPSLMWEYDRNLKNVMARMKGPYLMGDMMTVPDIILTHCATWAKFAKFPTDNADLLAYIKTTRARPAFQKLVAK